MSARKTIRAAHEATKQMDRLLMPAVADLQNAINSGNGSGVYFDTSRVHSALQNMRVATIKALEISNNTRWPTPEDYDT